MNGELLRLIESIHREKEIDKEILFQSLETALSTAIKKRYGAGDDLVVEIDRSTGAIACTPDLYDWTDLGRIAAQTAKQVMIQRLREAERDVVFEEYEVKVGRLVAGSVQRFEGEAIIVNLGRAEGILPKEERVRGELYRPGDRIRCQVLEVKKVGPRVKIILSRASADLVRRLFELEVPEIADGILEVKRIVREPGYRTKIAVWSNDPKVDCVGACVGVRGARIKSIMDELNGEKIDIVPWSESLEVLILNALKPAKIQIDNIFPEESTRSAVVLVDEEHQSLAIGKRGQNVRLASRLVGWDLEIKTRAEFEAEELARQRGEAEPGLEAGATAPDSPEGDAEGPEEVPSVPPSEAPAPSSEGTPPTPSAETSANGERTAGPAEDEGRDGGDLEVESEVRIV